MSYTFNGLEPPIGKYLEIFQYLLAESDDVKTVDLCCGLGFGKTVIAIQAAALTLNIDGRQRGLFLEPDWDRVNDIFLPMWLDIVPEDLYTISIGKNRINWHNGSYLIYRPRVITGAIARSRDKFRGIEFTFVVDDETAIGFDYEQYTNIFARIRAQSSVRYYFTLSTPKVGAYDRFINRGGNKVFRGRTADNHYLLKRDPTYEKRQRAQMSTNQARRELDGESIALEGRLWPDALPGIAWPAGNRNDIHTEFKPGEPWWIFCDMGVATGAYVVCQRMDPMHRGRKVFDGDLWVAVADLCPIQDASAARAFGILNEHFNPKNEDGIRTNPPKGITGGADINKRSDVDGKQISYFTQQFWGNVQIYPCSETIYDKQIQYDKLSYLIRSAMGERRFTVAKNFVSLEPDSHRGVREMLEQDAWPDESKRRASDVLPKNREIIVQHTRDALLMGAAVKMSRPKWGRTKNRIA